MKVNYKSDFDAILRLTDCEGNDLGWPKFDWKAKFYTFSLSNVFTASCIGGVTENCYNDGGGIHVVFDNHKLAIGSLQCEITVELPDGRYSDGYHRVVTPEPLDIELVKGRGDCPSTRAVAVVTLPVLGELTRADVEAMLAGKQDKRELTFGFMKDSNAEDWAEEHPDGVWFSRDEGVFYRNGELAEAGEECYNEVAEDGTVRANTRMVFRCNDTRYRFTGRELVNLDWATGGAMRRVFRVPTLNAHPGLFYLDRGYITVHAFIPCRISLKGLYWLEAGTDYYERIPLSECEVRTCGHEWGAKAHIEGDELVVERGATGGKWHWIHLLLSPGRSNQISPTVIGVRIRPDGGKEFYRCPSTNMSLRVLPPPPEEGWLLGLLRTFVTPRGKHANEIRSRDLFLRNRAQYEVWQRSRPRSGDRNHKRVWRWKKLTLFRKFDKDGNPSHKIVRGNHALFRIRIRHRGVWSEWGYFHVDFLGEGEVKARRSQPLHRAGGRPHPLTEADIDAMFKR
nr:MAG TPA: hypothetical protein [Bacteriophage sp.]